MPPRQDGNMVVTSIVGGEGTHHRQPIDPLRQLGQGAAKPDARKFCPNLPRATADVVRHIEFRIERLDLRRPALQEQEDDRFVLLALLVRRGLSFCGQQCLQC